MQINYILDDYETVAEALLSLLQEERLHWRSGQKEADERTLESKRQLIDQLTTAITDIRAYQESATEGVFHLRARIDRIQQKLMKILQLDREIEKLFLASSMRPEVPLMVPAAGFVGNAYRRSHG